MALPLKNANITITGGTKVHDNIALKGGGVSIRTLLPTHGIVCDVYPDNDGHVTIYTDTGGGGVLVGFMPYSPTSIINGHTKIYENTVYCFRRFTRWLTSLTVFHSSIHE